MLQFYYLYIGYTIYTTNEYYYDSLSKSIESMKFVNAFKCFAIKSLLEVGVCECADCSTLRHTSDNKHSAVFSLNSV
jgi:hypothetical protein